MGCKKSLTWIRRDIRLEDHRALARATEESERTAVVFVYDTTILKDLPKDDRRLTFIKESLDEVDEELRHHHSCLLTVIGDPIEEIPKLVKEIGAESVFTNHDDEPYAIDRDNKVGARLKKEGIEFHTFKDCVIFEKQEIMNKSGEPFKVYTPYSKAWKEELATDDYAEETPNPERYWPTRSLPEEHRGNRTYEQIGFTQQELWLKPGRSGALERLEWFADGHMAKYADTRNRYDFDSTSGMSVHLRHGTVSIRELIRLVQQKRSKGSNKWLNELIWREFYFMIMANFPHVVKTAFREEYQDLDWPGSRADFNKWKAGETGYPIVDAAMRCFNQTGWMHNRLRMVVAMFLTKDLHCHWQWGEKCFEEGLLDFELANNNGGWQWSASTGVDAQPYFRIFNPVLQSERHDPKGDFIREWCPELKDFSDKRLHAPWEAGGLEQEEAGCIIGTDYPGPIVDHKEAAQKAKKLLERQKDG